MGELPNLENRVFPVETVRSPRFGRPELTTEGEGNEVSFSPERGGIITSLKLGGKELLYLDEETFRNPEVNVKGGIPILFPNAGPLSGLRRAVPCAV